MNLLSRALDLCHVGKFDEAKKIYIKFLKKNPNHPDAITNLGTIYVRQGNLKLAVDYLQRSIKINPNQLVAINNLANVLAELGQYSNSLEYFEKAISIDPNIKEAYIEQGKVLSALGRNDDAIKSFTNAVNLDPNCKLAIYNRAVALDINKEIDKAIDDLNKIIEIDPNFVQAHNKLGEIKNSINDYQASLTHLFKCIEIDPKYFKAYNNLGLTFSNLNQLDDAINFFSKAIEINSEYVEAYNNLGTTLSKKNLYEEAINFYSKAIDKDKNPMFMINRALAFSALHLFEKAIQDLSDAILINPTYSYAYSYRGNALKDLKRFDEAIEDYKKSIELDSKNAANYNNYGSCLYEMKLYNSAIEMYKKSIEIDCNYAPAYNNTGIVYADAGNYKDAEENYLKAIQINENYVAANSNLAIMYLNKKEFEKGWFYYKRRFEDISYESDFTKKNISKILKNIYCENKVILIFPEQGLGDQILYLSMLSNFNMEKNKIIILVDKRLINLLSRKFPLAVFYNEEQKTNEYFLNSLRYDYFLFMGDMGSFFRKKLKDFKSEPYLAVDEAIKNKIQKQLKCERKIVCGISWKSMSKQNGENKSLRLKQLVEILKLPYIKFVNVQYGDVADELLDIQRNHNVTIENLNMIDKYNDINSLAALIDLCDLVITVSNVTAHISGSLGKKTKLLIPRFKSKLWYWHENDENSLWYPSVKQFFQNEDSSWESKIKEIILDIKKDYE